VKRPLLSGRRAAYLILLFLAAYVGILSALLRPTGGLRGSYSMPGPRNAEEVVHERIDPRIDFPVPQRIDAAYLFHWDMERHGFPARRPPYIIRWRGLLRVPRAGRYGFEVQAQGKAALRIGGAPVALLPDAVTELELKPGLAPLEIDYNLEQGEALLVLRWQPPGSRLHTVPSSSLAPDAEAIKKGKHRRALAWFLIIAGAAAAALALARGRKPEGAAGRLPGLLEGEKATLALGAILILAATLRFHDYALVPFHHETADEYQHAWEGWHLLHEGSPRAWSTFPDRYPVDQTLDFRWFGDRYVLVRPYFDHPPLFSLPVGLVCSLAGARHFLECSLPVMRLVPILLSLLGVVLLDRLARAYGASEQAALLAALVYATLPIIVVSHRLVKAESLLALLFMGAILMVLRHERTAATRDIVLAGVLCGLSLWTKATGAAVPAVVLIMMTARRRYRGALLVLAVAAVFFAAYLAYAWAYDFEIFLKVIQAQATTKWVSLEAVNDLLGGKVVVKYFGRGWYLWLLLCAGLAALRRERALLLPVAVYAIVVALTADYRVIYGWYRIPLYPFLCVAAGLALEEMIREADLFRTFPYAVTAGVSGLLYALPEPLAHSKTAVVLFAALALGPYLLRLAHDGPVSARLARGATYLLLLAGLLTSLASVGGLLEIYSATRGLR
jgi:hypothetical protein